MSQAMQRQFSVHGAAIDVQRPGIRCGTLALFALLLLGATAFGAHPPSFLLAGIEAEGRVSSPSCRSGASSASSAILIEGDIRTALRHQVAKSRWINRTSTERSAVSY